MNPIISDLFDLIAEHDELDCPLNPCPLRKASVDTIKEISVALNPQIPEPWASMSAEQIIKGMGVYR